MTKDIEPWQHLNIRISGLVQGVSLRWALRRQARALGIRGFVRNEADGTVYLEAEGEPGALRQLVAWCNTATPPAKVSGVIVSAGGLKHFPDFSITY